MKTAMAILGQKEIKAARPDGTEAVSFSDFAVFFAVCWVVAAFFSSLMLRIHWFAPGDFSYWAAMYYHGIMIPVLILLYLLTQKMFCLKRINERIYSLGAILSILLAGTGSIFNTGKGMSAAVVVQIIGMVMTDCLGIILVAAMAMAALEKDIRQDKTDAAFWLLLVSIMAIIMAAPLGHLAGWCMDVGISSLSGSGILLHAINLGPDKFLNGLVASHSHLTVAAILCGLAALTAKYYQYQPSVRLGGRISTLGLGLTLIGLSLATVIYVYSAVAGWEPPTFFASGPNGIPLDDLVLTTVGVGILLLVAGRAGFIVRAGSKSAAPMRASMRIAIFLNWVFTFAGSVLPGIYIEFHEGFYGGGDPPAPGALFDRIFIRAHMLYPFFLMPTMLVVLLAVGCRYRNTPAPRLWPGLFAWTSVFGMSSGLAGELLWFTTGKDSLFVAAMFFMGMALVAGMISLWPRVASRLPAEISEGEAYDRCQSKT